MKLADVIRTAKTVKISDAQRFAQHVVPEVVRPARIIWNQTLAGIFLILALFSLGYAFDSFRHMGNDAKSSVAFGLFLTFGLVMSFFALTSYMQARRIARPRVRRK